MFDAFRWYVVVQLIGLAALPIASRAFRSLPDRGYAFARPVGILAISLALWFGSVFGIWSNTGATVAVLLLVLAGIAWFASPTIVASVIRLWRVQRTHVLIVEGLFLGAFVIWAYCRAHFPNIEATEKPMEFGFLNGIIRSQRFPPADPWMSGQSISYYYLGYVMVAAITEISGVAPAVAFNLAIATLFALTVTGAFAIGYSLLASTDSSNGALVHPPEAAGSKRSWIGGGLAAGFVALFGNLEGLLELLHAHGVGSRAFWNSLAIWHLGPTPMISQQWYPTDAQDNWWWFRATRIILDYPTGTPAPDGYNTINEFPFFSFLLGDLHPHVLALPFAFVCIGFALNVLKSPVELRLGQWREHVFDLVFIALAFGSMFLLNAWDMLTYLFLLVCAFAARRFIARPVFDLRWLRETAIFGFGMLLASILVFWPFYLTFRSQASGLLGIVSLHSHVSYFLLFWGPFIFLAGSLVVAELVFHWSPLPPGVIRRGGPAWTRGPILWIAVALLAIASIYAAAPALAIVLPIGVASVVLILKYLAGVAPAVTEPIDRAAELTLAASDPREKRGAAIAGGASPASIVPEHVFALILIFVSMLLLFGTEVVFIDDSFHNRMNTVFKLYFQAWEMLAIVGAYTVVVIGSRAFVPRQVSKPTPSSRRQVQEAMGGDAGRVGSLGWLVVVVGLAAGAFVYVPSAIAARSDGFASEATLNGLQYFEIAQPDDAAAIEWLNQNVAGTPTIVEATGGSYSAFSEVAWMTGIPTLLGWDFHEIQWRGASIIPDEDERKRDIETIYRSTDARVVQDLLAKYQATYVYVGPMERVAFGQNPTGLSKFGQFMNVAYKNPSVTIYNVRGAQ